MSFIENQTFKSEDEVVFQEAEFVNCTFLSIDASNSIFNTAKFEDCIFDSCNLSNCKWNDAQLQNVRFSNCKMIGNSFEGAKPFLLEIHFKDCAVNLSSFYGLTLKECSLLKSNFSECEFSDGNFSGSNFQESIFSGAVFLNTNLADCDFRYCLDYAIDPVQNRIKQAKFSASEISGLLHSFQIKIE